MAKDSRISYSGKARRSSTASSQTTATRSRFSTVSGAVQPQGGYAGPTIDNASVSGWSNVTGFRRPERLNVPGSPESTYFNSGASKLDRRAEYIGRPLTESCIARNQPVRHRADEESSAEDSDEDEDEQYYDDGCSILPSDSASQAGRGRSKSSRSKPPKSNSAGLFGEVFRGRRQSPPRQANPPGPFAVQRSHTYSQRDARSMVGGYDGGRRYSVQERKPQGF